MAGRSELEIERAIGEIVEDVLALRCAGACGYFSKLLQGAAIDLGDVGEDMLESGAEAVDLEGELNALDGSLNSLRYEARRIAGELKAIREILKEKAVAE